MIELIRPLEYGSHGLDVKVAKRALKRAGFYHAARTSGRYGMRMAGAVRRFQRAHGLVVTGRIGRPTWAKLQKHVDAFGKSLLALYRLRHRKKPASPARGTVRARMKTEMNWGLRNERSIHYPPSDVRKQPNFVPVDQWNAHSLPIILDCSEAAVAVAKASGAPDPSGSQWGHMGPLFTGTILTHSRPITHGQLQVGDYVIYGPSNGDHVCLVYELRHDGNHILWSHGQEAGPILISMSAEAAAHRPPVRFRSAT